jgi:Tol biopolymer transport system component
MQPSRSWEELIDTSRRRGQLLRRRRRALQLAPLLLVVGIGSVVLAGVGDDNERVRSVDQPSSRKSPTTSTSLDTTGRGARSRPPSDDPSRDATALEAGGRRPTVVGTGERIAYTGADGIYVSRIDGAEMRYLGPGLDPVWAPDGTHLAFWKGSGSTDACRGNTNNVAGEACAGDIWVMRADGSGARLLMKDGRTPDWSPDGSRIAYVSSPCSVPGCFPAISVMNADGSNAHPIGPWDGESSGSVRFRPDWSPDSSRILYTRVIDDTECSDCVGVNTELWIAPVDGPGEAFELATGLYAFQGDWSPDGSRVAFAGFGRVSNNIEIYVMSVDHGTPLRVTNDPATSSSENEDYAPVWSADGLRLAFVHDPDGATGLNTCPKVPVPFSPSCGIGGPLPGIVWTMNADGTHRTRVREGTSATFSPRTR